MVTKKKKEKKKEKKKQANKTSKSVKKDKNVRLCSVDLSTEPEDAGVYFLCVFMYRSFMLCLLDHRTQRCTCVVLMCVYVHSKYDNLVISYFIY